MVDQFKKNDFILQPYLMDPGDMLLVVQMIVLSRFGIWKLHFA